MIEQPVDVTERRWVITGPSYQVQFWQKLNDPGPPLVPLWESEVHRLSEVSDVREILDWAKSNTAGRLVVIHAEVDRGDNTGLVGLYGSDPTRSTPE